MHPDDILAFCETMNFEPSSAQRQVFEYIQTGPERERGFRMGRGEGCTMALAMIALWRTLRSPNTLTLVVATTERQCKTVFFSELKKLVANGPDHIREMLDVSRTRVRVKGNVRGGIMPVAASSPNCFAGLSNKTLTVVIDGVIPLEIAEAIHQVASGPKNLIVQGISQ